MIELKAGVIMLPLVMFYPLFKAYLSSCDITANTTHSVTLTLLQVLSVNSEHEAQRTEGPPHTQHILFPPVWGTMWGWGLE